MEPKSNPAFQEPDWKREKLGRLLQVSVRLRVMVDFCAETEAYLLGTAELGPGDLLMLTIWWGIWGYYVMDDRYSSLGLQLMGVITILPFLFPVLLSTKHITPGLRGMGLCLTNRKCLWSILFRYTTHLFKITFYEGSPGETMFKRDAMGKIRIS